MATLVELIGITKRFPGVLANDRVSFALAPGEVLGILGENGAGKSTLMNVLSGLVRADSGEIRIDGRPVQLRSPRDAIAAGIGMVHQHFMLVATLTVAENVMLGDRALPRVQLPTARVADRVAALADSIGLPVDPDARVATLDIGGRQRVEIVKALYRNARILILDEPTAVLSRPESAGLFAMIRRLAADGIAVILISHKLDDIFEVCDRTIVMRAGRVVDAAPLAARSRDALVRAMVGEGLREAARRDARPPGEAILEVDALAAARDDGAPAFERVSFDLRAGEILALAGVEGNGQRELAEVLSGLRRPIAGRVRFAGATAGRALDARRARRHGLSHVPEDRHRDGVVLDLPLPENHLISRFFERAYGRFGWLRRRPAELRVAEHIRAFDVRAPHPEVRMAALSGGNQQKLVLARELSGDPRLLIAAHPTRGLDVRTAEFVLDLLAQKRADGLAVLFISADLAEIWKIADRIMVLAGGRLRGPVALADVTVHEVGAWMAGQ